jgi:hypothetical protein
MRLSNVLLQRTLDQLEERPAFQDAEVVPDDNPAMPQLNQLFGDHTFFLDGDGLHIIEPVSAAPADAPMGVLIKLASWRDERRTSLKPHAPEPTDIVVTLKADRLDDGADDSEDSDPAA